jgi:UDPglucose 6-dehydrogenase
MVKFFVIGAGVVGLASGKVLMEYGHEVVFVDVNLDTVDSLVGEGYKCITPDMMVDHDVDVSFVCVPTPMNEDGSVNLCFVEEALSHLSGWLKSRGMIGHLVVIKSTVLPTTTDKLLIPLIEEESGLMVGRDFYICYQPEFIRAVSSYEDSKYPWAIVIGEYNRASGDYLASIYSELHTKLYRVSIETAELIKYICNYFNALRISFSNEMWLFGVSLGIRPNIALDIASKIGEGFWNSSYGTVGGRPYGGSCLPKDTKGLLAFATSSKIKMPLLSSTIKINSILEYMALNCLAPSASDNGLRWRPSPMLVGDEV